MLNLVTRQIFISRDVSFHETVFPFISFAYSPHSTISLPHICPNVATPPDSMFLEPAITSPGIPSYDFALVHVSDQPLDFSIPVILDSVIPDFVSSDPVILDSAKPGSLPFDQGPNVVPHTSLPFLRRSSRATKPSSYLQDYECSTIISNELTQSNPIISKLGSTSVN